MKVLLQAVDTRKCQHASDCSAVQLDWFDIIDSESSSGTSSSSDSGDTD